MICSRLTVDLLAGTLQVLGPLYNLQFFLRRCYIDRYCLFTITELSYFPFIRYQPHLPPAGAGASVFGLSVTLNTVSYMSSTTPGPRRSVRNVRLDVCLYDIYIIIEPDILM